MNNKTLKSVETFFGWEMYIDPKDGTVSAAIEKYKFWEPGHKKLFETILFPGAQVIHSGGHIGYHDLHISSLIGINGVNHVFEPNPESYFILEKNILNFDLAKKNTVLHTEGTWNINTASEISFDYSNTGGAAIGNNQKNILPITLVKLDDKLKDFFPIDLLFMDIEGAELYTIQGAQNILLNSPNCIIVMEWSPITYQNIGNNSAEFLNTQISNQKIIYEFINGELIHADLERLLNINQTDIVISPREINL